MTCDDPELPGESNLALLAAEALCHYIGERRGAHIHVSKNIPVAAGLGGGSADAAAALRALNRLWVTGLSDSQLQEIAAGVGSDVPFLVNGGTALLQGRGQDVKPLPNANLDWLLLASPATPIEGKTALMFSRMDPSMYNSAACCPTNLPVESSAAVTYRRSFSSTYSGPSCAMCSRAGRSLTTGSCHLAQGRYSSAAPDPPCSLCRRAERSAWRGSCCSNNGGSGLSSPGHGGRTQPLHRDPVPELLTLAAGAITGAIMGLVFINHAALLLVWDPAAPACPARQYHGRRRSANDGELRRVRCMAIYRCRRGSLFRIYVRTVSELDPGRSERYVPSCGPVSSLRCWPCRQSSSCGAEPGTSPLSTL